MIFFRQCLLDTVLSYLLSELWSWISCPWFRSWFSGQLSQLRWPVEGNFCQAVIIVGNISTDSFSLWCKTSLNLLAFVYHRCSDRSYCLSHKYWRGKSKTVLDYNKSKGGVDTLDQMIGRYSCRHITFCWPLQLYM